MSLANCMLYIVTLHFVLFSHSPYHISAYCNSYTTPLAILSYGEKKSKTHCDVPKKNKLFWNYYCWLQGETQKFLGNCYKTQITSYMDMIYFYSSKYIPPLSIHLFARSFNFFMPSKKAVFEMLLSSLVTAHWISSTAWKCRPFKEIFNLGREISRQVQDLASKVGGGEQQRSCSPETFLQ